MTSSNNINQQQYHTAILAEMGIQSWQLQRQLPEGFNTALRPAVERVQSQTEIPDQVTSSPPVVENRVCLQLNNTQQFSGFIRDVLVVLGLDDSAETSHDTELAVCRFVWKQAGEFAVHGHELITPPVDELQSAAAKRTLWQSLQQIHVRPLD